MGHLHNSVKKPPLITYYELGLKPLMEMLKTVQILPIRHDLDSFKIKRHDLESYKITRHDLDSYKVN